MTTAIVKLVNGREYTVEYPDNHTFTLESLTEKTLHRLAVIGIGMKGSLFVQGDKIANIFIEGK